MTIETASYVSQLNPALPSASDFIKEGDNHINLIKQVLKNTFTNAQAPADLGYIATQSNYMVPIGTIAFFHSTVVPTGWKICDGQTYTRTDGTGDITTPNLIGRFLRMTDGVSGGAVGSVGGATTASPLTDWAGEHSHAMPTMGLAGGHYHGGWVGTTALTIAHLPWHNHGGGNHSHHVDIGNFGSGGVTGGHAFQSVSYREAAEPTVRYTTAAVSTVNGEGGSVAHGHSIPWEGAHTHTLPATSDVGHHQHSLTFGILPPYYAVVPIMRI